MGLRVWASPTPISPHPLARSGDHTVKIIDCFTGACVKVLEGHSRTPWVVSRISPQSP